jgi:catechol 2,3-dioxygenase-like lactoylglutathione lyase family enzyme
MTRTSWVEICVSNFEESIAWFERALGFRVVARDANDYAELSRGDTFIQLAADDAPYWASERPHLPQAGQRGSGVEIVLLVENIDAIYHQAQQVEADIVRPLDDYPWHMRQFWVRHPDGYLIRPAQKILSVNPVTYRHQIADAFQRNTPRIVQGLLAVKETAEKLKQQQDYLGAATIYQTLVTEIFEQSHLHYDETVEYDYDDEERYYPEEEGLEEFVRECLEALGKMLANKQADRIVRQKSIEVLFEIYQYDLQTDDSHGFDADAADPLVSYTTPLERRTLAAQIRTILSDEEEAVTGSRRQAYGKLWLELEKETLDDEAYLRICQETGRTSDLIDRLLVLGRIDEAIRETRRVDNLVFLGLADLFIQHRQDAVAERLVKARIQEKPALHFLAWLQTYYRDRGNLSAELDMAEMQFRTQPLLNRYQEIRNLARQLDRWETLRPELLAFLEQARNTTLLIQIALDEGDVDRALQLLKEVAKKDSYGYTYDSRYGYDSFGNIALQVASAAEETRPREAIELYQQQAERLIAQRDRQKYQAACTYLAKMRALYEALGEHAVWTDYIAGLRERNRNLRALKEELARAGL